MSLDSAFFVSEKLHEKKIPAPDGSEHLMHFRELSGAEWMRFRDQQKSEDAEVRDMAIPRIIAAALRNPDGSAGMTDTQAAKLKPWATQALFSAVVEVNTFGAKKPSPSAAATGSSSSSRSRSGSRSKK